MPWLPLVGSTMMESGLRSPARSASSIIFRAVRVLMEPPTFNPSYFTRTWALSGPTIRESRIIGVAPTASSTLLYIMSLT